ncbi:hypothetical protein JI667_02075 [Bacillus sp. NTK074B]|uniref:hypothetical protein n=1 Tax=Bacillus sp. NTK074B TaxID=2802174 RepID=UPI001A90431F|nr:hypothetical protein [Bacillus sp. NTK074B]
MPYTLLLLMIVLFLAFTSKDIYISKYQYLSNMKTIHERNISLSHAILLEMENESLYSGVISLTFGEVSTSSTMLNSNEVQMELTYKREKKVFLPETVVYNRETKQIIRWE